MATRPPFIAASSPLALWWWENLPTLRSVVDVIAGLQGKITPTDERAIRNETSAAITRAGGKAADVQAVQKSITTALQPFGGSTIPEFGGSPYPFGIDLKWWVLGGLAGLAAILLLKD